MKSIFLTILLTLPNILWAQTPNTLMSGDFWKTKPTIEDIKAEIAKGNSPSQPNAASFDPVTMAINYGATNEVQKFMIEQPGNSITKKTHHSRSYLHWAAAAGNLDIVNYLIKKGSDVNFKDSKGASIAQYAALAGNQNPQVFAALEKAGADINIKDDNGASLMLLALPTDDQLIITDYFVKNGVSLQSTDANGANAADYAAKHGNKNLIERIMAKGVKPTNNALFFAAQGAKYKANNLETYQYLIESLGLDAKSKSPDGSTMLQLVLRRPIPAVTNYFLTKGIDIKNEDKLGNTALMQAAGGKDLELVKTLLAKGNNLNHSNKKGESALTRAVSNGSPEILSYLINNGADLKLVNQNGENLVYYWFNAYNPANSQQLDTKLAILKDKGLNFSLPQPNGTTLLHLAVQKENQDLIKKALSLGVDINTQDKEGLTPLHKAALVAKDDTLLKLLISLGAKKELLTEFEETAYDLAKDNTFLAKVTLDFLK